MWKCPVPWHLQRFIPRKSHASFGGWLPFEWNYFVGMPDSWRQVSRRGVGGTMCWNVETSLKISQRRVPRSADPAEEDACSRWALVSHAYRSDLGNKRRGSTLEEFGFGGVAGYECDAAEWILSDVGHWNWLFWVSRTGTKLRVTRNRLSLSFCTYFFYFLVCIQFQDSPCPQWMFNMPEWVR